MSNHPYSSSSKSRTAKVLAGASTESILSLVNIVVGLVVLPIYFNFVTTDQYGLWLVLNGIFSFFSVADFGILVWLTREMADPTVVGNQKQFNGLFSTGFFLQAFIASIIFTIGLFVLPYMPDWLGVPNNSLIEFRITYLVGMLAFCIRLPLSTFSAVLNGRQEMAKVNIATGIGLLGVSVITIPLLSLKLGMIAFALSLLIAPSFSTYYLYREMKRTIPSLKLTISRDIFGIVRRLFSFSASFQTIKLAYMVQQNISAPIINTLFGPALVTSYSVTNRVPQSIFGNVARVFTALFPAISEMHSKKEKEALQKVFLQISYLAIRVIILSMVGILVCNKWFVTLWVGPDKFTDSATMLVLAVIMAKDIFINFLGVFIYATSNFGLWPVLALIEPIAVVVASYILGTHLGLFGVALGLLLPTLVSNGYVFYRTCKWLHISLAEYSKILGIACLQSIPTIAVGSLLAYLQSEASWSMLICSAGLILWVNIAFFEVPAFIGSKEKGLKQRLAAAFRSNLHYPIDRST